MLEAFFSNAPALVWLILAVILAVVEGVTFALISIWFSVGALAAMIIALNGLPLWMQILVFVAVSGIMLLLTKPLARKAMNKKAEKTNADRVIGQTGKVTQRIDNLRTSGQANVLGQTWTARSADDSIIDEGELIRVLEIRGVKIIVERVLKEEE